MVKTALPMHGAKVQSLVEELRSHMPRGMAKRKKKRQMKCLDLFCKGNESQTSVGKPLFHGILITCVLY